MNQRITGTAILALIAALAPVGVHAATTGLTVTAKGDPAKWDNRNPIEYSVDLGTLGKMSNSKAARMVLNATDQLAAIDTASISFEEVEPLEADVIGGTPATGASPAQINYDDFEQQVPSNVNPVIFDSDGSITAELVGEQEALHTLAIGHVLQATPTGKIAQGEIILNGRAFDGLFEPDDVAEADMTRAIERAFLQMLNVGESDLNDELIFDGNVANNTAVPIMYPGTVLGGGITPTLDDRIALSTLYPSNSFTTNTGVIQGVVTLPDGSTGIQGLAVILHNMDDPNGSVEAITGDRFENGTTQGARDPALRGAFSARVPPGKFIVELRQLRVGVGPLGRIMPLPGGTQFYQAGTSPTAGPDPASATPIDVAAGQTVDVKFAAAGPALPAAVNVTEVEPNDTPVDAPLLPANAIVTGSAGAKDPGTIIAGTGIDKFEDLYRIQVTEPSLVTLDLQPKDLVDLDLYVLGGAPGNNAPFIVGGSASDGTVGEYSQSYLGPGTYYVVVSAWEIGVANPVPTEYTLNVKVNPVGPLPERARPVLNQLVVGDITTDSAEARWLTDADATGDVVVGMPSHQLGDPTPTKTHKIALTGLTSEGYNSLVAWSQLPGANRDSIPGVYFRTANKTPVTGAAKLSAAPIGSFTDFTYAPDGAVTTKLMAVAIRNSGGNATNVQITGLTPTPGWKLALPVTGPVAVGRMDSGATAILVVRLLRDGAGPDPILGLTGTGTATGADGAAADFQLGP